jgi:hypothetical protein
MDHGQQEPSAPVQNIHQNQQDSADHMFLLQQSQLSKYESKQKFIIIQDLLLFQKMLKQEGKQKIEEFFQKQNQHLMKELCEQMFRNIKNMKTKH